jgi:arylsulfatase
MPEDVANEADYVRPWAELNDDEAAVLPDGRGLRRVLGVHRRPGGPHRRLPGAHRAVGQHDHLLLRRQRRLGEGTPNGSVNENKFFNGFPDSLEENLSYFDELGGPETYNHYPTGWAVAFSTRSRCSSATRSSPAAPATRW